MKRTAVIACKPECFGKEDSYSPNDPECEKCEISTRCIFASGTFVMNRVLAKI
jgi:hypothetical protein